MRDSNIELLRIVSMVLIIMHHFSVHGCFPFTSDLTFNKVFLQVFVVAFVFVICMCVDYLRIAFIEKPIMKRITSYIESSQSWVAQKVPF